MRSRKKGVESVKQQQQWIMFLVTTTATLLMTTLSLSKCIVVTSAFIVGGPASRPTTTIISRPGGGSGIGNHYHQPNNAGVVIVPCTTTSMIGPRRRREDGVVLCAGKKGKGQKKKKTGRSSSSSSSGGGGSGFGGGDTKDTTKNAKKGFGGGDGIATVTTAPTTTAQSTTTTPTTATTTTTNTVSNAMDMASGGILGRVVAQAGPAVDPFWEIIPALVRSRFPTARDEELARVAGVIGHTLLPGAYPLDADIVNDPHRPHQDIHAYMPHLGPTQPFHDPARLPLCRLLREHYDTIREEYHALLRDNNEQRDRFQSVTSMNYSSGWKTLVLFYNGHRIPGFPYHLCPTTTRILETVPLAGRIAGFNRQRPGTGIPRHSDGNNMWLTCQMGLQLPHDHHDAWIRVGPETRHWQPGGQCLVYDTTYEHETKNESVDEERVVLHVDFFNTLAMTPLEIEVMRYIYEMREAFMKAEGVAKVGAQIL